MLYNVSNVRESLTLEQVKELARALGSPIKFFSIESNRLVGTAYPDGTISR